MAYEIINKLRGTVVLRVVDNGATSIELSQLSVTVNGRNNVENVNSAVVSSLRWSTNAAGIITLSRQNAGSAANTIAVLHGTGYWPHDDFDLANSSTGNLQVTFEGGATGTLIAVLKKDATYNVDTQIL